MWVTVMGRGGDKISHVQHAGGKRTPVINMWRVWTVVQKVMVKGKVVVQQWN